MRVLVVDDRGVVAGVGGARVAVPQLQLHQRRRAVGRRVHVGVVALEPAVGAVAGLEQQPVGALEGAGREAERRAGGRGSGWRSRRPGPRSACGWSHVARRRPRARLRATQPADRGERVGARHDLLGRSAACRRRRRRRTRATLVPNSRVPSRSATARGRRSTSRAVPVARVVVPHARRHRRLHEVRPPQQLAGARRRRSRRRRRRRPRGRSRATPAGRCRARARRSCRRRRSTERVAALARQRAVDAGVVLHDPHRLARGQRRRGVRVQACSGRAEHVQHAAVAVEVDAQLAVGRRRSRRPPGASARS